MVSGQFTDAAPFERMRTDKHPAIQECPGRQNNGARMEFCPCHRTDARQNIILKEKIFNEIGVNC